MVNLQKTIMIVEDDEIQNDILSHILIHMGYNTIQSRNGKNTLKLLETQKPDLIIIDLNMPDITGFQLLKEIKDKPALSNIPVLMMSIDSSDESAILSISRGAEGFIHKPIKLHELFVKIKNAIKVNIPKSDVDLLLKNIRNKNIILSEKYSPEIINLVLGDQNEQEVGAKYTFASILSIRLHGLSALIHQIDSDKVQSIVNEAVGDISKIIFKSRGTINLIVNDLIISTFGIPVVYDKDTINALLCAEEIKNYEKDLNRFLKSITQQKIEISTTITSGKLYHGIVSAIQKINNSLIGTPLIRAFNLEKLPDSEHEFIIIDNNTREVIQEYINIEDLPQYSNIDCFQPHEIYRVTKILHDKIINITNLNKQYTPLDSVGDEGYKKL
ncbi:MAG: response regulator [Spirochaetia bacterium]|nr:response regulator [Spirochaetia bacterium]